MEIIVVKTDLYKNNRNYKTDMKENYREYKTLVINVVLNLIIYLITILKMQCTVTNIKTASLILLLNLSLLDTRFVG